MSSKEKETIIALMHSQVLPALGCTEPMAVALCVAKSKELLGFLPDKINVQLSANVLKNAMGVGIPGTGMVGLPIAIALGAIVGRSELGLEVLKDVDKDALERGKSYISEDRISIGLKEDADDKLYIKVLCESGGHEAEAVIKGSHNNFVYLRRDNDVLLNVSHTTAIVDNMLEVNLNLRKVYDFATETDIEELRFILDAKRMNEEAAEDGLRENFGHRLGKTMCSPLGKGIMGDSIFSKILSRTSCACDARMAGAMIPVMSNSGSGNQGICTTMPVVVFAEENHNTEEETIRALIISNLTAIYIKQYLGTLSALCGCVVASTGSSCGITYLMGGNYEQISFAVKNMIANLTGMICDGAKPSCALKLTTGVSTAVMSAMLAIQNKHVTSAEGIIDEDVDQSIRNLIEIGRRGMDVTDKYVLNIMTTKRNNKS
ncbi:MAG: L-serine ammonia-lyase, iron-sulfur-dependent, subunit alpha [Prevotella sp.]|nr:L-serine ammonia-lyase, iron-sulfur-dependent, subunit alpha [Prevotella sp.]